MFKNQRGFIENSKSADNLSTKILEDLKGKTTVSKQYILDATNRGELKQIERDITREVLDTMPGDKIDVKEFADKVKSELLPLEIIDEPLKADVGRYASQEKSYRYENIALPDDVRGKVKNYKERIYESPIPTSAGKVHFPESKNYFGHTRIEDMSDNKTRRVIEVQSDLYQKGNLEREYERIPYSERLGVPGEHEKIRKGQLDKLQQYNDPTAHFRMVREEIKKAAQDGKTKLQFPTGETVMNIIVTGKQIGRAHV